MKNLIIHVADINVAEEAGVGRVVWNWKKAFEERNYVFLHIGIKEVGYFPHKILFPYYAYSYYKALRQNANVILAHESCIRPFLKEKIPIIAFSHGLERRGWEAKLKNHEANIQKIRLSTRVLFPLWRLSQCDLGIRKATNILLLNNEDSTYVQNYYKRDSNQIFVFKNGVYPLEINELVQPEEHITILFIGTWTERKGIRTLVEAAQILKSKGLSVNWLLAGTGAEREKVLNNWPNELQSSVQVIPHFARSQEEELLAQSNIFVLPSFFEGQPLSLLQSMKSGRCCITTDCCGQRDLIQHGYNGLLHESGNAAQLAALIELCVKDKKLRLKLGENARSSVANRSWEAVSNEVVDYVEQIVHGNSLDRR